ncbi:MAG: dihydroorotate dehydrogenase, partial [Chloroflexi bacterium]|nr:dihydroorotate dehydrogenase [Chloroflexota bacterium]
ICGETKDEYVELAKRLEGVAGVSGIEVNISCPNVDKGCMEFGANPEAAYDITLAVKAATSLPVIIKLTPNAVDIVAVAKAVECAGADAISLINTIMGMAIDTGKHKAVLANVTGGLSGPAIKPIALYMVYKVARAVKIPVIGCGGIASTNDALEFIMAGACAIQVGTAGMVNPAIFIQIIDGINAFMDKRGIYKLDDIIGAAS